MSKKSQLLSGRYVNYQLGRICKCLLENKEKWWDETIKCVFHVKEQVSKRRKKKNNKWMKKMREG